MGPTLRRRASLFTICLLFKPRPCVRSPQMERGDGGHWVFCSSTHCGHIVTFLCFPLLFILE